MAERNVAIVGGGPAGLAAARVLLAHGAAVTLIDESGGLGGQYYKQFTAAPDVPRAPEIQELHTEGQRKIAAVAGERLTVRSGAVAWGIFPGNQLALYVDDRVELLAPDVILLASGAAERVAAFPGWTLPGVMTAGAAQTLLSREAILPGRRFLLAGTGPLLLAIAVEIGEAGGEVVAVIEGSRLAAPLPHARHLLRQGHRIRQAFGYARALRRLGIPLLTGRAVIAARGEGHVQEATVTRIDREWWPLPGTETRYEIDTLCLHYGFAASTELASTAGCALAFDPARGGWFVDHDADMRTSQPGIYVAGQVAGIGGADLAEATGHLAGLTVARDLGLLDASTYPGLATSARREVERGRNFATMLNTVYTPGPGLSAAIRPETLLCRCEEVRAAQVDEAIAQGSTTLNDVKRHTRCGMGFCQGRICAQVLAPYVAERTGTPLAAVGQFNARAPVKPVPLGALATMPDPDTAAAATADATISEH